VTYLLTISSFDTDSTIDISSFDQGLLWNSYMIDPLMKFRSRLTDTERNALDHSRLLTSVCRGFVKSLTVPASSSPVRGISSGPPAMLTIISRLSQRRAGTRFNSRGIDDDGNVANFVETETIFWSPTGLCFSYTQVRGSIPIFWESSSSLIPGQQKIQITRSPEATQPAFDKHFANLDRTYGAVHIVNLLSAFKPGEIELTERYRVHIKRSPLQRSVEGEEEEHHLLRETEFDFHERTKGPNGYEAAKAIKPYLESSADAFVYFLSQDIDEEAVIDGKRRVMRRQIVVMQQNGAFRVNCLDCLDRTNLIQGIISQMALDLFLSHRGERGNSDFWMRHSTLWADNGDTLSRIYAGTGALKSSFTRHGKMSLAGALADARKSATRLYVNHFEDKNKQNTVDLLLGRLVAQTSVDLFDPVNDWVVAEVARRRGEFESRDQLRLGVGTYNLNGKTAGINEDLTPWLDVSGRNLDVIVVGFQEIVELSPQQIMSTDPNRRILWEKAVKKCLNGYSASEKSNEASQEKFVLLRSGQLVGAALLVFVRASLLPRIKNVEGTIKKTGLSGIAGNKGAVAIRMDIESTSVCFVTAHLAAGFGNYEERNRDYNTITSGLRFQRNRSIDDHEVIVWAGDFNYRIGLGYEKTKAIVNEAIIGSEKIKEDALGKLYENDQLNIQMVAGNCFNYYREGRVKFLPTYKYDIGKDDFDSSDKQRIPAWTDRILWKVNHNRNVVSAGEVMGTQMKQLEYSSVMSLRFSDHRPVYAVFEMGIRVVDEEKKDELTKKLYAKRAREMRTKAGDSVEGLPEAEDTDDDSESVMESLMEYESIQEGLPPASSDKRKWWLDGNKGARSTVRPPQEGMMLNHTREGNPWREAGDDEWVKVEKPAATDRVVSLRGGKPEPPPPRQAKRMLPPVWEGARNVSTERSKPEPPAPRNRSSSAQASPARSPDMPARSSSTTGLPKKMPPPKPTKPSALTTTSSQVNVPQLSSLPEPVQSTSGRAAQFDGPAPPLPRRQGTASSTASFVSATESARPGSALSTFTGKSFPPPPPTKGGGIAARAAQLKSQSMRADNGTNGEEDAPPLPPRRAGTNRGLMDEDDEGGREGVDQYKPLLPS
jgi:synaptojanin